MEHWRSLFNHQLPFSNLSSQKNIEKIHFTHSPLESICWSPDGQILLVAFQNGNFYYLNAQNGKPLFFIDFVRLPGKIYWFEIEAPDQFNIENFFPVTVIFYMKFF